MTEAEQRFAELSRRVHDYRSKFIDPFIPANPEIGPEKYELDVKAFCLLSHAALEEFFEKIALLVMQHSVDSWVMMKKLTDTALMLIGRYGLKYELSEEDEANEISVYTHVRLMLDQAQRRFSKDVYDNHGASPKYLRAILVPIGIDFMPDTNAANSLTQLAKQRGLYAHRGLAHSVLSPEDALKYVEDCLEFAKGIRDRANQKLEA